MHSYDAAIDLSDRDTIKQDKPCAQTDWRPRGLGRGRPMWQLMYVKSMSIMMIPKYMLNQCCDYVDVKLI